MAKRYSLVVLILPMLLLGGVAWMAAQQGNVVIRREVELVQLNVAVTDNKGNYVTGLDPSNFVISEDGIPEKVATFEEGNEAPRIVSESGKVTKESNAASPRGAASFRSSPESVADGPAPPPAGIEASTLTGANVFILFDTSNYMYRGRGFVFAQDSMAEFVRSLDGPSRVAFYSYSSNLSRAAELTSERTEVLKGIRTTVNGAESALYNAMLLTLRDATKVAGKKVLVVFTNGPDNSSTVSPEEVAELAQSAGIPVYMISTREARIDPISSVVFTRMSANTGGEAYFAKTWKDEDHAFSAIRDDLAHLYLLSYYPQPNPNRNWRQISVKLVGKNLGKYMVRTRSGYRPAPELASVDAASAQ
jgi:Ca-activated chloride channel family protein